MRRVLYVCAQARSDENVLSLVMAGLAKSGQERRQQEQEKEELLSGEACERFVT
jgi:hypothetical protein